MAAISDYAAANADSASGSDKPRQGGRYLPRHEQVRQGVRVGQWQKFRQVLEHRPTAAPVLPWLLAQCWCKYYPYIEYLGALWRIHLGIRDTKGYDNLDSK